MISFPSTTLACIIKILLEPTRAHKHSSAQTIEKLEINKIRKEKGMVQHLSSTPFKQKIESWNHLKDTLRTTPVKKSFCNYLHASLQQMKHTKFPC